MSKEKPFFQPASGSRRIPVGNFKFGPKEKRAIMEVVESGRVTEGEKVGRFEKEWAKYIGAKYCVATNSGTAAIMIGLKALKHAYGLHRGSKVITSALSYIADPNVIIAAGFKPVFLDVDPITFGITPEILENYLKNVKDIKKHKIILGVDLMGYPLKIDEIKKIAKKYNLLFFEDAAQAHGSIYKGKRLGAEALLTLYSFFVAHNIQAGEMGALVTNSLKIFRLARQLKTQGRMCDCLVCTRSKGKCLPMENYKGEGDFDPRFVHDVIGYNSKTTEFEAALALTQLEQADEIIRKRQENVLYFNKHLEKFSDILQLPLYSNKVSYLAYPIVIKKPRLISRKEICRQLEGKWQIETRPLFGCIPTQQPAYAFLKKRYEGKLPNAEYAGKHGFYIGCHQYLTKEDLKYVVSVFKKIFK